MLKEGCVQECPGCAHRERSAAESQAQKAGWLHRALEPWADRIGALEAPAESGRWNYREKVRLRTEWHEAAWRFGMLRDEELIPIPECPVHAARVRAVVAALAPALPPAEDFPLAWFAQSGAQAVLVLKTAQRPAAAWLNEALRGELAAAGLEGLWLNLHPATGHRVFGSRGWELLWGVPRSRGADGLLYGPGSFQQALPGLHQSALDRAEAFLDPAAGDAVVDLCSGAGSTLHRWAARGARTIGVELGGEAAECARANAPGADVLRGRCAERLPQLQDWLDEAGAARRLLYANPPRTGLEAEVTRWIGASARPARLAYLSCSAGTLGRDLEALGAAGYQVQGITPYDFYPQTLHVEALALLARD